MCSKTSAKTSGIGCTWARNKEAAGHQFQVRVSCGKKKMGSQMKTDGSRFAAKYVATGLGGLRGGLGGFFGFTRGDFGLQQAILGAAVDLLFANAVETRGVATCFGHEFLFS